MKRVTILMLGFVLAGCSGDGGSEGKVLKISVLKSGIILADGKEVSLDKLDSQLDRLAASGGEVWYHREAGQEEPPPEAMEVITRIADRRLPVSLSALPDFSDVGNFHYSDATESSESEDGLQDDEDKLPQAAEQALRHSERFELLSLNPEHVEEMNQQDGFHGWEILGKAEIKDPSSRAKLVSVFKAGVAENDGTVAGCFNPRHGVSVTHDGVVHDFVICFECYSVEWFVVGSRTNGFLITDTPQPVFDKALKDAGLPLAE